MEIVIGIFSVIMIIILIVVGFFLLCMLLATLVNIGFWIFIQIFGN